MGGIDAQRGFICQSIIALIECLERSDWDKVKLEPQTKQDKVDIQLYRNERIICAIQVKSSKKKFYKTSVEKWLRALKDDAPEAHETCLYLVGDIYSAPCNRFIDAQRNEIKAISLKNLEDLYMGRHLPEGKYVFMKLIRFRWREYLQSISIRE